MLFSSSLGEKFHLSAPIVWAVSPWGQVVSVSFYLGRGPQAMPNHNASHWPPPRPGHPAVRLECWPPMKVFARYHAYHQAIQLVCFLFLFRVRPVYDIFVLLFYYMSLITIDILSISMLITL